MRKTFKRRLNSAFRELKATKIRTWNYKPPVHRLLWICGVEIPPPHYCSFLHNLVFLGIGFAASWGVIIGLHPWWRDDSPTLLAIARAAFLGLIFGLLMANYYRQGAKKYRLTPWRELDSNP